LPEYKDLPAFCQVAMTLGPSVDSNIKVEVWMPISGWNSRFVASGNGDAAGFIRYPELGARLVAGFAVAGTDTGHDGSAVDWSFVLGHPEKLLDLGYRSVHEDGCSREGVDQCFLWTGASARVLERLLHWWQARPHGSAAFPG